MTETSQGPTATANKEPSGIGGWLLLPIILLAGDALVVGMATYGGLIRYPALVGPDWYKMLALAYYLFGLLILALAIYCAACFFRKKRRTPIRMMAFFGLVALERLSFLLAIYFFARHTAEGQIAQRVREFLGAAIPLPILGTYFLRSVRAKNTFVS